MASETRHLSEWISLPAAEVYEYAADPAHLPEWAPGLGTSVERIDGQWYVDTADGRVGFAFAPRNEFGVLDHEVTLASGEVIYCPMRVIKDGEGGSEVTFALRRQSGLTDAEFDRDAGLVAADLARLKRQVESRAC